MDVNNVYGHPAVTVPQALPIPKTSVQTQVVTSVSKTGVPGQHRVREHVYVTTIYNSNGKKDSTTTTHYIDYLV